MKSRKPVAIIFIYHQNIFKLMFSLSVLKHSTHM